MAMSMKEIFREVLRGTMAAKKIKMDNEFLRRMEKVACMPDDRLEVGKLDFVQPIIAVCQESIEKKEYVGTLSTCIDVMADKIDQSGTVPYHAALCCQFLMELFCQKPESKEMEIQYLYRCGIIFCNRAISWGGDGPMFYATRSALEYQMQNYKNACRDHWIACVCDLHENLRKQKVGMHELNLAKLKSFLKELATRNYFLTSKYMNFWMAVARGNITLKDLEEVRSGQDTIKPSGYRKALQALANSHFREVTLHLLIAVEKENVYKAECYLLLSRIFLPSRSEGFKYFKLLTAAIDSSLENDIDVERFGLMLRSYESLKLALSFETADWATCAGIDCLSDTVKADVLLEAAFMRMGLEKGPGVLLLKDGDLIVYSRGVEIIAYNTRLLVDVYHLCQDATALDPSWAISKIFGLYVNFHLKFWKSADETTIEANIRLDCNDQDMEDLIQWSALDIMHSGEKAYLADYVIFELMMASKFKPGSDRVETAKFLSPRLPYAGSVDLYYKLSMCEDAEDVSVLEEFLKKDPDNFDCRVQLCVALHKEKKFDEAIDHLKQAVKLYPFGKSLCDLAVLAISAAYTEQFIYTRNTLTRSNNKKLLEKLSDWTITVSPKLVALCDQC